jgi:hypothetical protein
MKANAFCTICEEWKDVEMISFQEDSAAIFLKCRHVFVSKRMSLGKPPKNVVHEGGNRYRIEA